MRIDFVDGTSVDYDDGGNPLAYTGPDGGIIATGGSIVEQWAALFRGAGDLYRQFDGAAPAPAAQAAAPGTAASNATASWGRYVPMIALALLAAFVYRAVRAR